MLEIRKLSPEEQPEVLPLLGRCFPDYWEQLAQQQSRMPFDEISFAAYDNGILCGHCGVMLYEVYDCSSVIRKMGGIASVAVAPEFRGKGIASTLCRHVTEWAEKEPEIVSLPLYTGKFRVYESVSWRIIDTMPVYFAKTVEPGSFHLTWRRGSELSGIEKAHVAAIYAAGPIYPGKVIRKDASEFHGWQRIFADPELSFTVTPQAYAVKFGSVLAECGFTSGISETYKNDFFSSLPGCSGCDMLLPEFQTAALPMLRSAAHSDPAHGEKLMVLDLKNSDFHRKNQGMFFSLVDKF